MYGIKNYKNNFKSIYFAIDYLFYAIFYATKASEKAWIERANNTATQLDRIRAVSEMKLIMGYFSARCPQ